VLRKQKVLGTWKVSTVGGRPDCILYDQSTNKPIKYETLRLHYQLDAFLVKVLKYYGFFFTDVSRGDCWSIWAAVMAEATPKEEDVEARRLLFPLMHIYSTENFRGFWSRVQAEIRVLNAWGQTIQDAVTEKVLVEGLRYTLSVKEGQDLTNYTLHPSMYYDTMDNRDELEKRNRDGREVKLGSRDYEKDLRKFDEKRAAMRSQRQMPKLSAGLAASTSEGKRVPYCHHYQLPPGCTRGDSCRFVHEKDADSKAEAEKRAKARARGSTNTNANTGTIAQSIVTACMEHNLCIDFNKGGCKRKSCRYKHEKVKSVKRIFCKKCKQHHNAGECKAEDSHQAEGEDYGCESGTDDVAEEAEEVEVVGGFSEAFEKLTYANLTLEESKHLRSGLGNY
jgi:hypothetical protein